MFMDLFIYYYPGIVISTSYEKKKEEKKGLWSTVAVGSTDYYKLGQAQMCLEITKDDNIIMTMQCDVHM